MDLDWICRPPIKFCLPTNSTNSPRHHPFSTSSFQPYVSLLPIQGRYRKPVHTKPEFSVLRIINTIISILSSERETHSYIQSFHHYLGPSLCIFHTCCFHPEDKRRKADESIPRVQARMIICRRTGVDCLHMTIVLITCLLPIYLVWYLSFQSASKIKQEKK